MTGIADSKRKTDILRQTGIQGESEKGRAREKEIKTQRDIDIQNDRLRNRQTQEKREI